MWSRRLLEVGSASGGLALLPFALVAITVAVLRFLAGRFRSGTLVTLVALVTLWAFWTQHAGSTSAAAVPTADTGPAS